MIDLKGLRPPLVGLCALVLCGNAVPTSPNALAERSDLIAEVVVTRLNEPHPLPQGPPLACHRAEVSRVLKGHSANEILVCDPGVAEFTPPTPRLGQRYRMYLKRSSDGFYLPFSYESFRRLPEMHP